jgi:hypothetical protein
MDPSGAWAGYTSAVGPNFEYTCYENFSGLTDKIGGVHWWGFALIFHPSYGWMPCGDPSTMTFEIGFYQDAAGYPGTQVRSYVVQPTITDVGPFSWTELYYYSVDSPLPCCELQSGWVSIQSQAQYLDCVFLWLNSPAGDFSAYQQPAGGSFNQLGTNLAFCLTSGDCPDIFGACCDDYTSVCLDGVEWGDCLPPLRFAPGTPCADLAPPCGTPGACCDSGLNCVGTMLEVECDAIDGRFFPGQTCPEWVCPAECEHRIDLRDCWGDGWNGNTLDVLVNGATVLSQITLPAGAGPLTYTFPAATGDAIQTIFYPVGTGPDEPFYYIYDGNGFLLGQDGIFDGNCNYQPTGITVLGNCFLPTTGACCDGAGGCEIVAEAECVAGDFLGLGSICVQCPCFVPCPPGSSQEPEPCGQDTDGGCDVDPAVFVPIACGDTICGTTWANASLRDTDWYQVITDGWKCFTWTATGHVPLKIAMVGPGPEGCANATTWYVAWGAACQPVTIGPTLSLPAGEYWFWVSPRSYEDWPCDQNYAATLTCQDCPQDYCLAGATYEWEYISRVRIDTLDNLSGGEPGGYADYTYEQTGWQAMLAYGAPTLLTVNSSPPGPFVCAAWIDWNQDYVLEDGGDELIGDVTGVGWYSFTIVPPNSALPGRTRMRIRLTYPIPDPQPCGIVVHGEVEDYTVNVQAVPGACCWDSGACTQELPWNCPGTWGGPNTPCASHDCQPNGVDDFCDLAHGTSQDCQRNGIPDECDIANCPAGELWCCDCQGNGIPDGCELWAGPEREELSWDDGSSEDSFGVYYGGELCPIAHFSVASPGTVQAIRTCFGTPREPGGSGVWAGDPVRVYVWSDPNGDGNPADAVFLAEARGTVEAGSIDTDAFQSIAIHQVVSGSFFIGASVRTYMGYPDPMDGNGPQHNEAWITFNTVPFDPNNVMANLYNMHDIGFVCNWLLRAEISWGPPPNDCNNDGWLDECDIGVEWGGPCVPGHECFPPVCSSDWNDNGIPDECELCGDLNHDGSVDFDDYWMFHDAFGTCVGDPKYNPAADLDGDGCVTLVDYRAWRMCYLMANGKEFVAPKPKPVPLPAPQAPQGGTER